MKNTIKILLFCLGCSSLSFAAASPFGISCTKPTIADKVRDHAPVTFTLTCKNGTPATFPVVRFDAHQLSSGTSTVNIEPIQNMTPGQQVDVQGTITLNAASHYIFDFDATYGGATHPNLLCAGNPNSSNCLSFTATDPNFLSFSDIHYGKGDTDDVLWANSQAELQQLIATQKPQFILLLGDLPAHGGKASDQSNNIQTVFQNLSSTIHIPLYYVPGNNDSLGGNYHSFTNANGATPFSLEPDKNWPTLNVSHSCTQNPSVPCTIDTRTGGEFGYYSARPVAGLRLIALNSVIFSDRYVADDGVSQQAATDQELNWLQTQLNDAQNINELVIIAMHIPFGLDAYSKKSMWASPDTANRFIDLMTSHKSIIQGIYTGHTHMDELRRLYDVNKNLAVLDISTPSITPDHANNPGMKVFSYDPDNLRLSDMFTYYTTPSQSNVWQSYSFRQDYACGTKNIFDCSEGLSISNKAFTDPYDYNYSARNPAFPAQPLGWQGIWDAIDTFAAD